jgi:hypothetical protein
MVGGDAETGTHHFAALFYDGFGRMEGKGTGVGNTGDQETLVV